MQTFADTIRYRFVLENLVAKNLKTLYRNQALGFVWAVVQPLVMMFVLTFVMVYVFDGGNAAPAAMAIVGIVPFNFISYCLSGCAMSVVGNAAIVKKVAFPRQLLPFSVVATNLIHLAIQVPLLVLVLFVDTPPHAAFGLHLLWLPVIFAIHLGLAVGVGLLVAALNVGYRDVQYAIDSLMTVLFWLCPVMYDSDRVRNNAPDWVQMLYFANPLTGVLDAYRSVLFHGRSPDINTLGLAGVVTLLIGALGIRKFWVHERDFADLL